MVRSKCPVVIPRRCSASLAWGSTRLRRALKNVGHRVGRLPRRLQPLGPVPGHDGDVPARRLYLSQCCPFLRVHRHALFDDAFQGELASMYRHTGAGKPPLKEHVETLVQIRTQDLEPDPHGGGSRIRDGVAADRRISIEDKEMRHGRKSKSKRFNGFKRHIAAGRRSRADPRLRHHACESPRGRSHPVLDRRPGAPGTRRRLPADRPRVYQQHARR